MNNKGINGYMDRQVCADCEYKNTSLCLLCNFGLNKKPLMKDKLDKICFNCSCVEERSEDDPLPYNFVKELAKLVMGVNLDTHKWCLLNSKFVANNDTCEDWENDNEV